MSTRGPNQPMRQIMFKNMGEFIIHIEVKMKAPGCLKLHDRWNEFGDGLQA